VVHRSADDKTSRHRCEVREKAGLADPVFLVLGGRTGAILLSGGRGVLKARAVDVLLMMVASALLGEQRRG
jgi:hypothetical protein